MRAAHVPQMLGAVVVRQHGVRERLVAQAVEGRVVDRFEGCWPRRRGGLLEGAGGREDEEDRLAIDGCLASVAALAAVAAAARWSRPWDSRLTAGAHRWAAREAWGIFARRLVKTAVARRAKAKTPRKS